MLQPPIHSDLKADVLDAIPVPIAVHDTAHNIVWANMAYLEATGLSLQEIEGTKGHSAWQLDEPCRGCPVTLSIEDGEPHEAELPPRNQDHGPISQGSWLSKAAPLKDAEGRIIGAVETVLVQDLAPHKHAEKEANELRTQFVQTQEMEAMGRLAGGIAHGFNNVLTIIKGHVQFVLDDLEHARVSREDLEEVLGAAESAHAITRQLLTFSRQQGGEPTVINLAEVIGGAEKMIRRSIGEDVEFDVSLEPDLGRITVDPAHVEQVLLNLAVNARDAMPQGGRLNIKAQNVTRKTEAVVPGFTEPMKPGRYVRLVITDTGTGMDEATRTRVFEPFFSTKPQGVGTGLGLSVVFGIVKQTDGYIRVLSAPGEGTTFEIYLPRADGEPTEHMERQGQSTAPVADVSGSETVLVVEDQPGVRSIARRALERAGYTVLEAPNGVEALDVYEGAGGAVDLVLTDMVMPVMGGLELGERLRERDPELPVLFMSGYEEDEITRRGVQRAEMPTIEKPFGPEALQRMVREVLDQARTGG